MDTLCIRLSLIHGLTPRLSIVDEFNLNLSVNDDNQSDKQSVHKELALFNLHQ